MLAVRIETHPELNILNGWRMISEWQLHSTGEKEALDQRNEDVR